MAEKPLPGKVNCRCPKYELVKDRAVCPDCGKSRGVIFRRAASLGGTYLDQITVELSEDIEEPDAEAAKGSS